MNNITVYTASQAPTVQFCQGALERKGIHITEKPGPDVTHLLLPVPSFEKDGRIRGGGILEHILSDLPEDITVVGGNLQHAGLQGYKLLDLLADGEYLARNAAITADCAIRVAVQKLEVVLEGCPVLILGWGRIGKCLAAYLKQAGALVTVAARQAKDREMLMALGYSAENSAELRHSLGRFRVIFNTVPTPVLDGEQVKYCRRDCLKIELASKPGICGKDVVSALGLPGKMAPESAGELMAKTILRKIAEEKGK